MCNGELERQAVTRIAHGGRKECAEKVGTLERAKQASGPAPRADHTNQAIDSPRFAFPIRSGTAPTKWR